MEDDGVAGGEAAAHLGLDAVALADLDDLRARAAVLDHEHRPALATAEEAADRHLQDPRILPDDHAHLDAVAVAQLAPGGRGIGELDDHVDALLLDAERRHLHEAGGLNPPDAPLEGHPAAPLLEAHRVAGRHPDGVARQQVGDHLEVVRIADLDERLARRHHGFALAIPLQHDPVDRRADLDRTSRGARLLESRARHLQVVVGASRGELGRAQGLLGETHGGLGGLEGVERHCPGLGEALLPLQTRARPLERRRHAVPVGADRAGGRLGGVHRGGQLCLRA